MKFGEARYRPGSLKKVIICVEGCPGLEEDDGRDWVVGEGFSSDLSSFSGWGSKPN